MPGYLHASLSKSPSVAGVRAKVFGRIVHCVIHNSSDVADYSQTTAKQFVVRLVGIGIHILEVRKSK